MIGESLFVSFSKYSGIKEVLKYEISKVNAYVIKENYFTFILLVFQTTNVLWPFEFTNYTKRKKKENRTKQNKNI